MAIFKDFENMPGKNPFGWAEEFDQYIADWRGRGHWNYRQESLNGCLPEVEMKLPGKPRQKYVALVFNDYLGFSHHPKVKAAAIAAIERFGVGSTASPAIGGYLSYHRALEEKIAAFFRRKAAMLFTTGYTANTATMQALLKKEDFAILDMNVHASIYEGCQLTNSRVFPHNNMEKLERILRDTEGHYRTRMVIVDGVYSQPADMAQLDEVIRLARQYGALVAYG